MLISRYTPSVKLARFIKCYYFLENTYADAIRDSFFADGCIEAVFSVGWDFYKEQAKEDWAKVIGQIIKPRNLEIVGKGRSFGIWFYPHTFSFFSPIPMFELNDCVVSWDQLFPNSFAEFAGNCLSDGKIDELIKGADEFLINRLATYNETSIDRLAESAIRYLYQHKGGADLNRLSSLLNVSPRHLQRTFSNKIGLTQKQFVRMLRFQELLQKMNSGEKMRLTSLAYEYDYCDQSHFIREFKAFTGLPPSDFTAARFPINQHFLVAD